MRTIKAGKEPIASLWRASSEKSENYRLLHYHVRIEGKEGTHLLNTVTGELIQLNTEETQLIDHLPMPYVPDMEELIVHRFLVPETFNELMSLTQLRKVVRSLSFPKNKVTAFTILPTTICNARCFYCYESDYPHNSMSNSTLERLVDYIEAHCGESKTVTLSWFGGEPTIGEKSIDFVCERLRERKIAFRSSMISNGYLFTREMARKAKESWRLQRIQITLDGTEEVYNNIKAYVNPVGSPYQRVMSNIKYLLEEKISVSVRMNLDHHNAENLKELINELAVRFSENEYFSVYVHELFEGMGFEPIRRSEKQLQEIIEIKTEIESLIDSKGLKQSAKDVVNQLPHLKTSFCMADNPVSVLVNPDGMLGKCQHVQYSHLFAGLKGGDFFNEKELAYWLDYLPRTECMKCPLCPWCGVPQTCESGRSCIPLEVDRKINAVKKICSEIIGNNNG